MTTIQSGFRAASTWFNFWWYKVPEPRFVSVIIGISYAVFTLTGVLTLAWPPVSFVWVIGNVTMTLVGWFFVLGGVIGMVAGTREFWKLERVGIVSMAIGLIAYTSILSSLHVTQDGSRLTQIGIIIISLCLLSLRMAMIWRYDYKPRG